MKQFRGVVHTLAWGCLLGMEAVAWAGTSSSAAQKITLLHTNDLHSHFRPTRGDLALGGVSRLKTALQEIRSRAPDSLLVDGGDWSEGQIYYRLGIGLETLRMMEFLGYDVAIVGNHDWLNGPRELLNLAEAFRAGRNPSQGMGLVATNLDLTAFESPERFRNQFQPAVIREVGGRKIAFLGATTYEFIFDRFFSPVKITPPIPEIRKWARKLRSKVDAVVVISHNQTRVGEEILREIPEVDLVIGGHDHETTPAPIVVKRRGARNGWVVEAGEWGKYLGKLELVFEGKPGSRPRLQAFQLIPIDERFAEDPETEKRVTHLEAAVEAEMGPIFKEKIAHSDAHVTRTGSENMMGNLVTDAYREIARSDLALEQAGFIYGEIYPGPVTRADIFNALPAVMDAQTRKTWTVQTFEIEGWRLSALLNVAYSAKSLAEMGVLQSSGLEFSYDPFIPWFSAEVPSEWGVRNAQAGFGAVHDIYVGGKPLQFSEAYSVAVTQGLIYSAEFLNKILEGVLPLSNLKDTGVENWRALEAQVTKLENISAEPLLPGKRGRSAHADLAVFTPDLFWDARARQVQVTVRNLGLEASTQGESRIEIYTDLAGADESKPTQDWALASPVSLPAIPPGGKFTVTWNDIPEVSSLRKNLVARIVTTAEEDHRSNQVAIRHFK